MNTRSHLTAGVRRGSRIVPMLLVLFLFGSWNVLPTQGQPIQGQRSAPVVNDVEFRMVKFDKLVRVGYRREAKFYTEALAVRLSVVPYVGRGIEPFLYIGTTEIRGHDTLRRPGVLTLTFYASEREALKERHRYSEWAGRSTAP